MRQIPQNTKELELHQPELWQLELLKLNPELTDWESGRNYMAGGSGFSSNLTFNDWGDFMKNWAVNNPYNQVVSFYFEVGKLSAYCPAECEGGDHRDLSYEADLKIDTKELMEITQDELEFFVKQGTIKTASHGRLYFDDVLNKFIRYEGREQIVVEDEVVFPPLDEVNKDLNKKSIKERTWLDPLDLIDWYAILRLRRSKAGLPITCPTCKGNGKIYGGECKVDLNLWIVHPSQGASRGLVINNIKKTDLKEIFNYIIVAEQNLKKTFGRLTENAQAKLEHIKSVSGSWKDHSEQTSRKGPVDS